MDGTAQLQIEVAAGRCAITPRPGMRRTIHLLLT